jgi:hypothetical protein
LTRHGSREPYAKRPRRFDLSAVAIAVIVAAASLHWTSTAIGGADQYGYLTLAGLLRQGRLVIHQDVVRQSPWPFAEGTWTPIGYTEVEGQRDAITPVYPPGLPLVLAAVQRLFGYCAGFWIVPLCAGVTVWLTYVLGRQTFERAGLALGAAALVAASPTLLNQSVAPLSDVPATMAWTLALVCAIAEHPLAAGAAAAAAILIRPNLVPLTMAFLAWSAWRDFGDRAPKRIADSRTIRFAIALTPSIVAIAWLNTHLHGSPLRSGYGDLQDLYSWSYLGRNVAQFSTWMAGAESPVVVLGALFFVAPRLLPEPRVAGVRILFGGFLAIVIVSYLFYLPFDAWWFLRFLLPMWPIVMILTVAAMCGIIDRVAPRRSAALVALVVAALAARGVVVAFRRGTFDRASAERRFADVSQYLAVSTEPSAVFISWQQSGAIRLYANRLTVNFARIDRRWLDTVIERLAAMGRHPYLVIEGFEADAFRQRFSGTNRFGSLDWPPIAVFETPYVAVYDPLRRTTNAPPFVIPSREQSGRSCRVPAQWPPSSHLQ